MSNITISFVCFIHCRQRRRDPKASHTTSRVVPLCHLLTLSVNYASLSEPVSFLFLQLLFHLYLSRLCPSGFFIDRPA